MKCDTILYITTLLVNYCIIEQIQFTTYLSLFRFSKTGQSGVMHPADTMNANRSRPGDVNSNCIALGSDMSVNAVEVTLRMHSCGDA